MIKHRVFVVGCPRSGTTLLQGMLAAHPRIASFPESHFFAKAYPQSRLKRLCHWPALNVHRLMTTFVAEIQRPDLGALAQIGIFECQYEKSLIGVFDALTEEVGKDIWVEKTPMHLRQIRQIARRVSHARFIHIVRNGMDTVRSLYDAANHYPVEWKGERSVEACVQRWNHDVLITAQYRKNPLHLIVRYEELIGDPVKSCVRLCEFLEVDFDERMVQPETAYNKIVRPGEAWKSKNSLPPTARQSDILLRIDGFDEHPALSKIISLDFLLS